MRIALPMAVVGRSMEQQPGDVYTAEVKSPRIGQSVGDARGGGGGGVVHAAGSPQVLQEARMPTDVSV
jgi:hypothetical protein